MSRLARENRVLFIESLGLRQPQLAGRDICAHRAAAAARARAAATVDGLHVLSPLVIPLHGSRARARAQRAPAARAGAPRGARGSGCEHPILWAYVPQAEVLIDALEPSLVVYHCVDDISAHERIDTASFRAAEDRFAARADLVLASAPALAERMRALSSNVLDAPNVADTELFATRARAGPRGSRPMAALPRAADRVHRRDRRRQARHRAAARAGARAARVVVRARRPGRARRPAHRRLARSPPSRTCTCSALRSYAAAARGAARRPTPALIPYARNELTESIFPMKVYEYLAAGLPVVATPLPALAGVAEVQQRRGRRGHRRRCSSRRSPRTRRSAAPRARAPRRRTPGSGGWRRSPRRCKRCERPAGDHAHAGAGLADRPCAPTASRARWPRTARLTCCTCASERREPDAHFSAIAGDRAARGRALARRRASGRATRAPALAGVPAAIRPRHLAASSARGAAALAARARPRAGDRRRPDRGRRAARLARRRPVIYNAHNLESGFRRELGGLSDRGDARAARVRARVCWSALPSPGWSARRDIDGARELCPQARLRYVPNVVDVAAIAARLARRSRRARRSSSPTSPTSRTATACASCSSEVFPRVWAELPDARLVLVGGGLEDAALRRSARGGAAGSSRISPAPMRDASCAVVPLLQGGGTPLKLIEALAYGLPVIATPRARRGPRAARRRGLPDRRGRRRIRRGARARAARRRARDRRSGRELAAERYSIEALSALLAPAE